MVVAYQLYGVDVYRCAWLSGAARYESFAGLCANFVARVPSESSRVREGYYWCRLWKERDAIAALLLVV